MSGFNPLIALLTSSLWFTAVFLGAKWVGPAWDSFVQRHIADITPRLRALGMDGPGIHRWMRLWGIVMFSVFVWGEYWTSSWNCELNKMGTKQHPRNLHSDGRQ